jgi:C4-dicarboxylate-specific signal transduction histidine kinase
VITLYDLPETPLVIHCVEIEIRQIIRNIILNSKLSFEDKGKGLSEEIINRIFDPHFTTKTYGHGLGLAICQSIVTKHKGHIQVSSENGKGTKFEIFLPRDSN